MTNRDVRIDSYFSLPTDLAGEMGAWPEFVEGKDYDVRLRSPSESVDVSIQEDEGRSFVRLRGAGQGPLFHRVLGTVVHAMSAHSDDVWITRWSDDIPSSP